MALIPYLRQWKLLYLNATCLEVELIQEMNEGMKLHHGDPALSFKLPKDIHDEMND